MAGEKRFRLTRKFMGPRWLTEGEGELVGYSLDIIKDAFIKRLYLGHLARFPQTAPPDALAAIGRDRRVIPGLTETPAAYAQRLIRWLDDRKTCGNPFSLLQKLSEYTGDIGGGCTYRTVDARGNWYTRMPDGSKSFLLNQGNWNWDGSAPATRWSRFWVIIYPPSALWVPQPHNWGDTSGPSWGQPVNTVGSTATADEVQTIRAIVKDWKPAGTRCVNVIIAFDPASFSPASPEPDGTWGLFGGTKVVAGRRVDARLSTARYWDGV